jgi:hypothetical protein
MPEKTDHRPEGFLPGPGGSGSIFEPDENAGGMATVCHGPYIERLPVCSLTVREVRGRFGDRLDIDPESQAVIDGNEVDDDTVVQAGQLLTFVRKAGEKG